MSPLVLALTAALLAAVPGAVDGPRIVAPAAPAEPVSVVGLPAVTLDQLREASQQTLARHLAVYVATGDAVPAILGTYAVTVGEVTFVPRFPFMPRQNYRVVFAYDEQHIEHTFVIAASTQAPTTTVMQVYPTAATLPENLLKFYVYFSGPMKGGDVYDTIDLFDQDDNPIEGAFVRTVPELWDWGKSRLTLICHPGRIKRGLALHEQQGAPLKQGGRFRLVVSGLLDASGLALAEPHEKVFEVAAADRHSPDTSLWRIEAPVVDTLEPLRLNLAEPLDHALLERMITVVDDEGIPVVGRVNVLEQETVWSYTPDEPWAQGLYSVLVYAALEDLAGNRLDRLFDEESRGGDPLLAEEIVRLEFEVH